MRIAHSSSNKTHYENGYEAIHSIDPHSWKILKLFLINQNFLSNDYKSGKLRTVRHTERFPFEAENDRIAVPGANAFFWILEKIGQNRFACRTPEFGFFLVRSWMEFVRWLGKTRIWLMYPNSLLFTGWNSEIDILIKTIAKPSDFWCN